jgi:predicted alpha/beta-fold hydrolase
MLANAPPMLGNSANLKGHFWTLGPFLRHSLLPPRVPSWQHWETSLEDEVVGPLQISGRLTQGGASNTIVVIIHGLGGSATSYYARRAALAAARAGIDSLRINLRGADRGGADYYHAGLTEDLAAAIRSEALEGYENVLLLAYSLGGNMALRYLAGAPDRRVRAAAAVCSPIDLQRSARAIDQPRGVFYRRHVLSALKEIYRHVAERRDVPLPVKEAARIDTIELWDERIIAPRHGFAGAEDYWAKTSACNVLDEVRTPTLFIAA